jgi:hypothetical protein
MVSYESYYYNLFPNAPKEEYKYLMYYLFTSEFYGANSKEFLKIFTEADNNKLLQFGVYLTSIGINSACVIIEAFMIGCKEKDIEIERLRNKLTETVILNLVIKDNN